MIDVKEIVSESCPKPIRRGVAGRARRGNDPDDGRVAGQGIRYLPAQRCGALPGRRVATVAIGGRLSGTDVA